MLKYQLTLILILIGCIAFVACDRTMDELDKVMVPEPETMEPEMMVMMADYASWENRTIPGPWLDFKGDVAHDLGARTIYFNELAAAANKDGAEVYPVGSMIVKASMDETNMFISQISTMEKTDGTDNGGWVYGVTGPASATAVDHTMVNMLSAEMAVGASCVGCHANATNDFVFVPLTVADDDMNDDSDDMNDDSDDMNDDSDDMNDDSDDMNGGAGNGNGA